jgi:hypothetical protein
MRVETRRWSITLVTLSWGMCVAGLKLFIALHVNNDSDNATRIDLGVTNNLENKQIF